MWPQRASFDEKEVSRWCAQPSFAVFVRVSPKPSTEVQSLQVKTLFCLLNPQAFPKDRQSNSLKDIKTLPYIQNFYWKRLSHPFSGPVFPIALYSLACFIYLLIHSVNNILTNYVPHIRPRWYIDKQNQTLSLPTGVCSLIGGIVGKQVVHKG